MDTTLHAMYQCIERVLHAPCGADKLWRVLNIITYHPTYTSIVLLISYLLFVLLFSPFYLISFLIYPLGSLALFLGGIVVLARYIARCLIFPGHIPSYQKQVTTEVLKQFLNHWATMHNTSLSFSLSLQRNLTPSNTSPASNVPTCRPQDVTALYSMFPTHLQLLLSISNTATSILSSSDAGVYNSLLSALQDIYANLSRIKTLTGSSSPLLGSPQLLALPLVTRHEIQAAVANTVNACQSLHNDITTIATTVSPKTDTNTSSLHQIKHVFATILSSTAPLTGFPLIVFPLLRSQLFAQYPSAVRLTIASKSSDIDAVYIPHTTSCTKIALLCNPNAGFYECLALSTPNKSWLAFYYSLGYNICLFNYAGYGSSTGKPNPNIVKENGVSVANYLMHQYKPSSLLLHGESIGGLVASHIASTLKLPTILVCDRTFHDLNAVASRMMGSGIGCALKIFGQWKTDVWQDYKNYEGHKIILQDPKDEVISYSSSLAIAVAAQAVLSSYDFTIPRLDTSYSIALYNKIPPPVPTAAWFGRSESVTSPATSSSSIPSAYRHKYHLLTGYMVCLKSHSFYQHFTACILHLKQRAEYDKDLRQQYQRTRSVSDSEVNNSGDESDDVEASFTTMKRSNSEAHCSNSGCAGDFLSVHEKIWRLFGRCHAGNLYTVQSACAGSVDGVVAWVVNAAYWGNSGNILHVLHDYTLLVQENFHTEPDEVSLFVAASLECIIDYQQSVTRRDGVLIDVHCGHNGWPNEPELNKLTHTIQQMSDELIVLP